MATKLDPIKTLNQFQILNTIRIAGAISRTELAQIIGHSRATVTNIIAKMIASDLIYEKETEGSSVRGRNRVMLAILLWFGPFYGQELWLLPDGKRCVITATFNHRVDRWPVC